MSAFDNALPGHACGLLSCGRRVAELQQRRRSDLEQAGSWQQPELAAAAAAGVGVLKMRK